MDAIAYNAQNMAGHSDKVQPFCSLIRNYTKEDKKPHSVCTMSHFKYKQCTICYSEIHNKTFLHQHKMVQYTVSLPNNSETGH